MTFWVFRKSIMQKYEFVTSKRFVDIVTSCFHVLETWHNKNVSSLIDVSAADKRLMDLFVFVPSLSSCHENDRGSGVARISQ